MRGAAEPKPRFVTTVHGLNSPGFYSGVMTRGERVICVSGAVREYVLAHYPALEPHRIAVIPRGVDPAESPHGYRPAPEFRPQLEAEHPELAGRDFITLPARGTRLKGHHSAIELLARLKQGHGFELGLLLLGVVEPGRERYLEELRALTRRLGIADRVAFCAPRAEVRDVFALSSLVLQLSRQPETFGRTVLEALSLGVPVLGYAHGGVGELLRELFPAGVVPPGESELLVAAAVDLLRHRPMIEPLKRYRLADMQRATLALYEELAVTRDRRKVART